MIYLKLFVVIFAVPIALFALDQTWFNHGYGPVDSGFDNAHKELSAESCKACHMEKYRQWESSMHGKAWTSPVFVEGFLVEKNDRCVYCHAPLVQQFSDYKKDFDSKLLMEGVNCASCHLRKAKSHGILPDERWKVLNEDVNLKDSKFCAGCHQFNLDRTINGKTSITDVIGQNTYVEWQEYQRRGGLKTCQQCHMPNGSHEFHGAHNRELLKKSLDLKIIKNEKTIEFQISSVNVGHNLPTGDVFRHLTLEIAKNGKSFEVIKTFGKKYEIETNPATGFTHQVLADNTSIGPFEVFKIQVPVQARLQYRIRYFYASPKGIETSNLPRSDLIFVVKSGVIP